MWWRIVLGMVAGVVSGAVLAGVIELLSYTVIPAPAGIDMTNPEQVASAMHFLPLGTQIAVVVAWAVGSFVGGMIAVWIGRSQLAAFGVGGIMLGLGIWAMMSFPHPVWMMIAGAIALFVPAVLGGYLVSKRQGTLPAAA